MQTIKSALIIMTVLLLASISAAAQKASPSTRPISPEALVADLYRTEGKKSSPFFQTRSRALLTRYFTKTLADLLWKDAVTSKGEVGALEFDPLYNAQDMDIKKFLIHKPRIASGKAEVIVSFENSGKKEEITFVLLSTQSNWKIANIRYDEETDLIGILKGSADTAQDDSFAGSYRVGETNCTVKPIKMAFEVRWARQTNTQIFFFDSNAPAGQPTYVSEDKGKGIDRFVFDNDRLESGKFTRTDGEVLTISKIK
jgi:hypothetical protein